MDGWAIASGFGIGVIVGMTGVGGGSLMTPLLIGAFHLNPAVAIGTDLWFAAVTKSGGGWAHARLGHVDWAVVRRLLAGSLPASLATLAVMAAVGVGKAAMSLLTVVLGVALLLTALSVAWRGVWPRVASWVGRHLPAHRVPAATVTAGALLGVLVSLSSIGAGAVGATLILLLYPSMSARRVVGTDIAHAVPLTLVAGIGHAWMGHVDWSLLGLLLIGSLPGIWLGARLTRTMPEALVRGVLCVSLTGAALRVLT